MAHEEHKQVLQLLNACIAACNHCASACLEEQEVAMLARCIKTDIDCAEICSLTAAFVARDSEFSEKLLVECAAICDACAEECEKHAKMGMRHCEECARACRECADACRAGVAA